MIACGGCGRLFKVKLPATTLTTQCDNCGGSLTIPGRGAMQPSAGSSGNRPRNTPKGSRPPGLPLSAQGSNAQGSGSLGYGLNVASRRDADLGPDLGTELDGMTSNDPFSDLDLAASGMAMAPALPQSKGKLKRRRPVGGGSSADDLLALMLTMGKILGAVFLGLMLIAGFFSAPAAVLLFLLFFIILGCCYIVIIIKMFRHGRADLALFSMFGMPGSFFVTAVANAMGLGGLVLFLFIGLPCIIAFLLSLMMPMIVGTSNAQAWRMGPVMAVAWVSLLLCVVFTGSLFWHDAGDNPRSRRAPVAGRDGDANGEVLDNRRAPTNRETPANGRGAAGGGESKPLDTSRPHVTLTRALYVLKPYNGQYVGIQGNEVECHMRVDVEFYDSMVDRNIQYLWVIESRTGRTVAPIDPYEKGTFQIRNVGSRRRWEGNGPIQSWVEAAPLDSSKPLRDTLKKAHPRVSEVVTMHPTSTMPPPLEFVPID